jgi:hypothetical protein
MTPYEGHRAKQDIQVVVAAHASTMALRSTAKITPQSRQNTISQRGLDEDCLTSSSRSRKLRVPYDNGEEVEREGEEEEQEEGEEKEEAELRQRNRTPKRSRARERIETAESEQSEHEEVSSTEDEEQEDVCCISLHEYDTPIRIYSCLRRPEYVAYSMCLWERQHNIDQLIDVHETSLNGTNTFIPNDAKFILVGERIMLSPYGHAVIFARMLNADTPEECYEPVVGFYYSYEASNSTIVWSMNEYFDGECMAGNVDMFEKVGPEDARKFKEVHGLVSDAVDREMKEVEAGTRALRNLMGDNRKHATRWRSKIVGDDAGTASGY